MSKNLVSGADALVAALERHAVEFVFGVPGTQNIPFFEALRTSKIRTVLASSETMAGFMAIGAFRASGKPGVFAAIAGPGFAFAVPPLAEAALDSSAIILITGTSVSRGKLFDHQAIDQDSIINALTGSNVELKDVATIASDVEKAFDRAAAKGSRPVVLQISSAVLQDEHDIADDLQSSKIPASKSSIDPLAIDLKAILNASSKPLILAGAAALNSAPDVAALAEALNAVVIATPPARGIVAEGTKRVIPVDLLCDDVNALNGLLDESDLVIALGCRLSHNTTAGFQLKLPAEKLLHVHDDAAVLNANYESRWALSTDVGAFLTDALESINGAEAKPDKGWIDENIAQWRARILQRHIDDVHEPVWPESGEPGCRAVFEQIRAALPDDGILVTDTGSHQIHARKYFEVRAARGLIVPTDFQSMGFGLPAAIGAALAAPERKVIGLVGDGTFLMAVAELATIAREQIPLVVIVFADGWLGQIRLQQVDWGAPEFATKLHPVDHENVAKSFGIHYERATQDLANQIRRCLDRDAPVIIEVKLDDPAGLTNMKRKGRTKDRIKRVIGPTGISLLKKLAGGLRK